VCSKPPEHRWCSATAVILESILSDSFFAFRVGLALLPDEVAKLAGGEPGIPARLDGRDARPSTCGDGQKPRPFKAKSKPEFFRGLLRSTIQPFRRLR
jgi:hypothetical protein